MTFRVSGSPTSLQKMVRDENRSSTVDFLFKFLIEKFLNIHRSREYMKPLSIFTVYEHCGMTGFFHAHQNLCNKYPESLQGGHPETKSLMLRDTGTCVFLVGSANLRTWLRKKPENKVDDHSDNKY